MQSYKGGGVQGAANLSDAVGKLLRRAIRSASQQTRLHLQAALLDQKTRSSPAWSDPAHQAKRRRQAVGEGRGWRHDADLAPGASGPAGCRIDDMAGLSAVEGGAERRGCGDRPVGQRDAVDD